MARIKTSTSYVAPTDDTQLAEFKYIKDSILNSNPFPVGAVLTFAGQDPYSLSPVWLICDGIEVSRTTYSGLFGVIGTTYGVGNGSTTFNLPDLTLRTPICKGPSDTIGTTEGISNPNSRTTSHTHSVPQHTHTASGIVVGNTTVILETKPYGHNHSVSINTGHEYQYHQHTVGAYTGIGSAMSYRRVHQAGSSCASNHVTGVNLGSYFGDFNDVSYPMNNHGHSVNGTAVDGITPHTHTFTGTSSTANSSHKHSLLGHSHSIDPDKKVGNLSGANGDITMTSSVQEYASLGYLVIYFIIRT